MAGDYRNNLDNYSVLMSVYSKEKPEHLKEAMDSIWDQTIPADDFVLVCDGPLNAELDAVIMEMQREHADRLRVVRLDRNHGLGYALDTGLTHCRNELVARMDSDDISMPDRCERHLRVFASDPEVSICSGIIEEFLRVPNDAHSKRVVPEHHREIMKFAKIRNPFNHPCVMFKKSIVESSGGYKDLYFLEDYYLWIRMLSNGAIGYNIQKPLLWMRTDDGMYRRRRGLKYAKSQRKLFKYMYEIGFINRRQRIANTILRYGISAMPPTILKRTYRLFLRKVLPK